MEHDPVDQWLREHDNLKRERKRNLAGLLVVDALLASFVTYQVTRLSGPTGTSSNAAAIVGVAIVIVAGVTSFVALRRPAPTENSAKDFRRELHAEIDRYFAEDLTELGGPK